MSFLILAFIAYLLVLIIIGILTSKYNKNLDDFLMAGRKLGSLPVAISAEASDMSGWLVMGLPGRAFVYGISAIWVSISTSLGTLFNWSVIAKRLRRVTGKLKALTIPDYLEKRLNDNTYLVRGVSTAIIVIFMIAYVSVQFVASGKIISETFGWDYSYALLISFAIITFYTLMGGFFAVAWTDVFQGLLIVLAMVVVPIAGVIKMGGMINVLSEIGSVDNNLLDPNFGYSGLFLIIFLLASTSWFFGYPGQPHIITRYMAIKDEREIRKSAVIGMIWVIISLWGAVFIGIVGLALFKSLPDPEKVMPFLATNLLPEWFAGIVIAAIVAAIMSTADSQLLVAASSIVEDIYHKLINKNADQKKLVRYSRLFVLLLSIFALALAIQGGIIYYLVAFAWGGLAASFGPVIILSLWWKRITKIGALSGMISGTIVVILWDKLGIADWFASEFSQGLVIPGMLPGFFISFILIVSISLLTKPTNVKDLF